MSLTHENIVEIISNLSLEGKGKLCAKINGLDFIQEFLQVYTMVGTQAEQPIPVNDEPSGAKADHATVGKTRLIDALLLPRNGKQKTGEVAKSTQLLHQAGINRSFTGSHLQQVKHAMRKGSIKLVGSLTSFGVDNELEGKKLDPHDHESVKLYLSTVGKIKQDETQGRGYLKAGLTVLDQIHRKVLFSNANSISVISKPKKTTYIPTKECNKKVVYVLTNNRSFKEPWVKIGHSIQLLERLGTLNTSHPFDFVVEGWVEFDSDEEMKNAEKTAHDIFNDSRVNKEYFLVDPREALRVIRKIKI